MESWGNVCCPKLNIIVGCQTFECLLFFAKRNYQLLFSIVKPHVNINLFLNDIPLILVELDVFVKNKG